MEIMFKRLIALLLCFAFSFTNLQYVKAQDFSVNQLPVPGTMVGESAFFAPLALKGLVINPQKPLEFQFIVDTGKGPQDTASIKEEANKLVKYFLAGLTIPEKELWVNLSPYEKTRITTLSLGQTELGRDLLAQDYILKQLTASLIYPEKDLGKEFWDKVYTKAQEQFGTTNIPVNTFNKVWILPDEARVFENGSSVYVTKATLKVMLDEDYLAKQKHQATQASSVSSQIVREIVLPEIEKEVNEGKNFAPLRQIYQALILAKWYRETIQNGLLDAVYTDKKMVSGVNVNDPAIKEEIYERYLKAYKKGVFNYIKEDLTPDGQFAPRKYFSGGTFLGNIKYVDDKNIADVHADGAMISLTVALREIGRKVIELKNKIRKAAIFSSSPTVAEIENIYEEARIAKSPDEDIVSIVGSMTTAKAYSAARHTIKTVLRRPITVYYPGPWDDIVYPLITTDGDEFLFVDADSADKPIRGLISSISQKILKLGGKIINKEVTSDTTAILDFEYLGRKRQLYYYNKIDASNPDALPKKVKDGFDIYMEKALSKGAYYGKVIGEADQVLNVALGYLREGGFLLMDRQYTLGEKRLNRIGDDLTYFKDETGRGIIKSNDKNQDQTPPARVYTVDEIRKIFKNANRFKFSDMDIVATVGIGPATKFYSAVRRTINAVLARPITVYYPGPFTDITHPLITTDGDVFLFVDYGVSRMSMRSRVLLISGKILKLGGGITKVKIVNNTEAVLNFRYRGRNRQLYYYNKIDASNPDTLPQTVKDGFDVYVEKSLSGGYGGAGAKTEEILKLGLQHLKEGGFVLTDFDHPLASLGDERLYAIDDVHVSGKFANFAYFRGKDKSSGDIGSAENQVISSASNFTVPDVKRILQDAIKVKPSDDDIVAARQGRRDSRSRWLSAVRRTISTVIGHPITVYYPGPGSDIINPLISTDGDVFLFVDIGKGSGIRSISDKIIELGGNIIEGKRVSADEYVLDFTYLGKNRRLYYYSNTDASKTYALPQRVKDGFDIYVERNLGAYSGPNAMKKEILSGALPYLHKGGFLLTYPDGVRVNNPRLNTVGIEYNRESKGSGGERLTYFSDIVQGPVDQTVFYNEAFINAVKKGNRNYVKQLLVTKKVDVNARDRYGNRYGNMALLIARHQLSLVAENQKRRYQDIIDMLKNSGADNAMLQDSDKTRLFELIESKNNDVMFNAASALSEMLEQLSEKEKNQARNPVVERLHNPDPGIRQKAIKTLQSLGMDPIALRQAVVIGENYLRSKMEAQQRRSTDEAMQTPINDKAALSANGGIDLNHINVVPTGKMVKVQFDQAQLNALTDEDFEGFMPIITGFKYIQSPLPLLGIGPTN
jgi:hypothetical protein